MEIPIGKCSLCGGTVMREQAALAYCSACGAREDVYMPTIRMRRPVETPPRPGGLDPTVKPWWRNSRSGIPSVSGAIWLLFVVLFASPAFCDGWFPKLSPSGLHTVSGAGSLTLDGRDLGIVGWGPVFETETTFVFTGVDGLYRYDLTNASQTRVRDVGFNEITAGGGQWAAWRPNLIDTSIGVSFSGAGNPAMNSGGSLAYLTPRDAAVHQMIVGGQLVTTCVCDELDYGQQIAVWTQHTAPTGAWYVRLPDGQPVKAATPNPAEVFVPRAVDTPEGAWIGAFTNTGLILQQARPDQALGYRWNNGGETYYPSFRYRADLHAVVAVFTDQHGVPGTHTFPLDAPLQDLSAPIIIDPPPGPIDPPPDPIHTPPSCDGFSITITTYPASALRGVVVPVGVSIVVPSAAGRVTDTYADLRGDGFDGQRVTYTSGGQYVTGLAFVGQKAGTFDLHAEANTEFCHAETGAQRLVKVQ